MTTFTEADHPRAAAGTFTDKTQSAPEASLGADQTWDSFWGDAIGDNRSVLKRPHGVTETRSALRNSRGEAAGELRFVDITWDSVPPASSADDLEIVGPKDGRPIIVHVPSGFPDLVVKSGHAIIVAASSAGNRIKVRDGARATVLSVAGRKVSITADAGSTLDLYFEEGARGFHSVDPDANFTSHGDPGQSGLSRRSHSTGTSN